MSCFELPEKASVVVNLPSNITKEQLLNFPAFTNWLSTLRRSLELQLTDDKHPFHETPYSLRSITIQSVDWFGPNKIGFIKLVADVSTIRDGKKDSLSGIVFLRGGSVAMLIVLRPRGSRDERYVVMTEQPRVPAGDLTFMEIPAGIIEEGSFAGNAAREIEEETGMVIPENELVNLTSKALGESAKEKDHLQKAMYPSPGGSDEYIPIFLWEKEVDRDFIDDLRGKLTGLRTQGEKITLRLVDYETLWLEGARDAKTLAAWALYEGLKRAGRI